MKMTGFQISSNKHL